jgi:hypothetical protein
MRRDVWGSAFVLGALVVGCGVRPAPVSTAPILPVQSAAQAAKGNLTAKKVLMPPLQVYKTVEENQKRYLESLRKYSNAQQAAFSPVLNTVQISVAGEKAGYFVSAHGNAVVKKPDTPAAQVSFLVGYLIDAKGQLSFSHTMGTTASEDRTKLKRPTREFTKKVGDLHLRVPQGDTLPAAIVAKLNAQHDAQQNTIIDRFPDTLQMYPVAPEWWNFGTCEIWYQDKMVGYFDDPAAWMWEGLTDKPQAKYGFMVTNLLDPAGGRLLSEALAVSPTNPLTFKTIAL